MSNKMLIRYDLLDYKERRTKLGSGTLARMDVWPNTYFRQL